MATPDSRVQKAPSAPVAAVKTAVKDEPKKAPEVPKITVTMDDAVIAGLPAKATNSALSKKLVAKSALTDPVKQAKIMADIMATPDSRVQKL